MAENKKIADIIAEMRKSDCDEICPWWADGGDCVHCPMGGAGENCPFGEFADRLEAAWKRECGDMAKMREVMNRVHDYLGELIRDNLVEDTPRASDLADDVYDAIHGSRSAEGGR